MTTISAMPQRESIIDTLKGRLAVSAQDNPWAGIRFRQLTAGRYPTAMGYAKATGECVAVVLDSSSGRWSVTGWAGVRPERLQSSLVDGKPAWLELRQGGAGETSAAVNLGELEAAHALMRWARRQR